MNWRCRSLLVALMVTGAVLTVPRAAEGGDAPRYLKESYTFEAHHAAFVARIFIQPPEGESVSEARLLVSQFIGADGSVAIPSVAVGTEPASEQPERTIPLQPSRWTPVELRLSLEKPQIYEGQLALAPGPGNPTQTTRISVTRKLVDLPLQAVVAANGAPSSLLWGGRGKVGLTLLNGTSELCLTVPALTKLSRLNPDGTESAVDYQTVSVKGANDRRFDDPMLLPSATVTSLVMEIHGLSRPGKYSGAFNLSASGYQPKTVEFTLLVRAGWWVLAACVFLGAAGSFLLRLLRQNIQPRLAALQAVLEVREQFDRALRQGFGQLEEREERVIRAVMERLAQLRADLEAGKRTTIVPDLAELIREQRLAFKWLALFRELKATRPIEAVADLVAKLKGVEGFLLDSSATEASGEGIKAAQIVLDEIRKALTDHLTKTLTETIEALRGRIDQTAGIVMGSSALNERVQEIRHRLDRASLLVTDEQFAPARGELDRVLHCFVLLRGEDLRVRLSQPRPEWFTDGADWEVLQRLREDLDRLASWGHEEAGQVLDRVGRAYASRLKVALIRSLRGRSDVLRNEPERVETLMQMDDLRREVERNPVDTPERWSVLFSNVQLAEELFKKSEIREGERIPFESAWEAAATPVSLAASALAAAVKLPAPMWEQLGSPVPVPAIPLRFADSRAAARMSALLNGLIAFILFILAAALGLFFLWADNPTWGSTQELVFAVGFGSLFDFAGGQAALDWLQSDHSK